MLTVKEGLFGKIITIGTKSVFVRWRKCNTPKGLRTFFFLKCGPFCWGKLT